MVQTTSFCLYQRILDRQSITEIKNFLETSRNILITTHLSPDGDAIGSSLALAFYLKKRGHEVTVVTPDDYPRFLHWLPGNKHVLRYNMLPERSQERLDNAELVFCLDCNDIRRLGKFSGPVAENDALRIVIDHHQDPTDMAKYMLVNSDASSTAELIYEFLEAMGDEDLMDEEIAQCLYAGIVTDTGSFKFPLTSAKTHYIAARIKEAGVDTSKIHNLIYDNSTEDRLRLLGYALTSKLKVLHKYNAAIISLNKKELERFRFNPGDTEGIVNYPLSIGKIRMAVLVTEKNDEVRLSFRSKGSFPVNQIAKDHFSGGGHLNAAGGISSRSVEETVQHLISILPEYAEALTA